MERENLLRGAEPSILVCFLYRNGKDHIRDRTRSPLGEELREELEKVDQRQSILGEEVERFEVVRAHNDRNAGSSRRKCGGPKEVVFNQEKVRLPLCNSHIDRTTEARIIVLVGGTIPAEGVHRSRDPVGEVLFALHLVRNERNARFREAHLILTRLCDDYNLSITELLEEPDYSQ